MVVKTYDKCILHEYSQFSYVGGNDACTYICNEVAIHALQGVLSQKDDNELRQLVDSAVRFGILSDKGLGHRSCDEVHNSCPRFKENLRSGSLYCGKLKDPKVFLKLIDNLMTKAKQRDERGARPLTCVILTKPPETILLCCDATKGAKYPIIIFDSHPRSFENGSAKNGAGFYMFSTPQGADGHLKQLFPYDEEYYSHLSENMAKAHVMYEATLVELSSKGQSHFIPVMENVQVQLVQKPALQQMVISGNVFNINNHFYSPVDQDELEKTIIPQGNPPRSLISNAINFFIGHKEPEPTNVQQEPKQVPVLAPAPVPLPQAPSNESVEQLREELHKMKQQMEALDKENKWLQSVLKVERDDKTNMLRELIMLRSENTAFRLQFEEMTRKRPSF